MKHVMIDHETMGKNPTAPILTSGAILFDPAANIVDNIDNGFYRKIAWDFTERVPDESTLRWWMNQEKAARMAVCDKKGAIPLEQFLVEFAEWLPKGAIVWGNGATFDISMLENAYLQFGMKVPWAFWDVMDVRTVVALAKGIIDRDQFPFEGVPHHALHDANHQAKYVTTMWQHLRWGR